MTTPSKQAPSSTQVRRIKVNRIFYDYTPKNASPYFVAEPVPWLQMKGKWLAKAGFTVDTPVKIEVAEGRLILTTELTAQ